MCLISTNATIEEHIKELKRYGEGDKLERRLIQIATEASRSRPGALDNPGNLMKRMPADLREARKLTFGRHRVYYIGHHTQCRYSAFYVKINKKSGVNDEDYKPFQKVLVKALSEQIVRALNPEDDPDKP